MDTTGFIVSNKPDCRLINRLTTPSVPEILRMTAWQIPPSLTAAQHLVERHPIRLPGQADGDQALLRPIERALRV